MHYTSAFRAAFFLFAIFANILYARFLLNPAHAQNIMLYSLVLIADLISIVLLTYTWLCCFYFEVFKNRYYSELASLKEKGKQFIDASVAVLIPVVNEPVGLIKETIEAARKMRGNKIVYLLDDGNRPELRDYCEREGIRYIIRTNRRYNKAGNMNNALKFVKEDFVAVFDADFLPDRKFLTETLPFFADKSIGIVQTPQVYYNDDTFFSRGFKNFQQLFYKYVMPAKSMQHAAFCVGTNVVYRRSALERIGGFPKIDHSEDVNTSLKMYEVGYRTLFYDKELALGRSPENALSFFNQQFRWAKGGLTMLFHKNPLFNKKLTGDQRLHFFFSNFFYLSGISIVIYLFVPVFSILFGSSAINPVYFTDWLFAYLGYFLVNYLIYSVLVKKNIFQSLALGIFCYVPYLRAMAHVIFNRQLDWKTTHASSKDVVTGILAPLFPYVTVSFATFYLLASGILPFTIDYVQYAFWLFINAVTVLYLMVVSYLSAFVKKSKSDQESTSFQVFRMQGA
jgi:cellulose synthase (UDP-forming)